MEMVVGWLLSGFNWIIPFVILISLTVFVHELGHFLVAKYFGVRVEVFSIGMGKKIWKRRYGDTEYAISLFPIGGYVKMFGDELGAEIEAEHKASSFVHKPVMQRIGVVLAGPIMNLVFAFILFVLIAVFGDLQKAPVVGDISEQTEAFAVGFRSGDSILSVNSQAVRTWAEAQSIFDQSIGKEVTLKVVRHGGGEEVLRFTPKSIPNNELLSLNKEMGSVAGLTNLTPGPGFGVSDQNSWAYKAGFRTGDFISKFNGKEVKFWRDAEDLILNSKPPYKVTVMRAGAKGEFESVDLEIQLALTGTTLATLGLERGELFLRKVMPDSPAQKAGLQEGDKLLEIQGQSISSWDLVNDTIKGFKAEDKVIAVKFARAGEVKSVAITPQMTTTETAQGLVEDRFVIGIVPWLFQGVPEVTTVQYGLGLDALSRGLERTWEVTAMTVLSFVKLFKAEISPKNIGGIISIGIAASRSFEMGLGQFFSMMGTISISLFILNLLPVPVLDGGHMVFYTIELIKGSPLSLRKMELAQRFGIVVLMSLMVFALFNDFTRLFFR